MRNILITLALLSTCNASWAEDIPLRTVEQKRQDIIAHDSFYSHWIKNDVIEQVNRSVWFPLRVHIPIYVGDLSVHQQWLVVQDIKKELEQGGYIVTFNEAYDTRDIGYMTVDLPEVPHD